MRYLKFCIPAVAAMLLLSSGARAENTITARVETATDVLRALQEMPEQGVPPALLRDAQGIAVIPGVIKAGFIVGGRYGKGLVSVRSDSGWSPPAFLSLTGGSIGWQIGAQSTDLILVFKTERSIRDIAAGKVTLGGDAAIAAGPVGRSAQASTDAQLQAEIYSYSRSRGLFAGISLEGAALTMDIDANRTFYADTDANPWAVLEGKVRTVPPAGRDFQAALGSLAGGGRVPAAAPRSPVPVERRDTSREAGAPAAGAGVDGQVSPSDEEAATWGTDPTWAE